MSERLSRALDAILKTVHLPTFKDYDLTEDSIFWTHKVAYADGIIANVNVKVRFFRPEDKKRTTKN